MKIEKGAYNGRSFYVEQIVKGTLCTEGYAQTRIPAGVVKWPLPQLILKITLSLCLLIDVVLLSVFFLTVFFLLGLQRI